MCVWKARDDEEETGVFRLRFPIATFYSLLVISFLRHQVEITSQNRRTEYEAEENIDNETPQSVLCNRRNPYVVSILKTNQIHTAF